MTLALDFNPLAAELCQELGSKAWMARRGQWEYTIVTHPLLAGRFEIAVTFRPDYLPRGPFDTLEEAVSACNQTMTTLEG